MSKFERGNILFYILITVILFAAISFFVGNMIRGVPANGGSEKSSLKASEILQYASLLRQAVQTVMVTNGCTENQISFENSVVGGYENIDAPSDFRCHIFKTEGGGLSYNSLYGLVSSYDEDTVPENIGFTVTIVPNIGTTSPDLIFFIRGGITPEICNDINLKLGVVPKGTAPSINTGDPWTPIWGSDDDGLIKFNGNYSPAIYSISANNNAPVFCGYDQESHAVPRLYGALVYTLLAR